MYVNISLENTLNIALQRFALPTHARILVACSGGPDSVVLAALLHRLGYTIGLAHVNYRLRAEQSDAEETLVRKLAADWNIPVFVLKPDTYTEIARQKKSLQVVARDIRYAFFAETMAQHSYTHCATAHHADDHAETILHSLLRENAPCLLHGIPAQREAYIRPLLGVRKEELIAYATAHQLPYSIDSSNLKTDYTRNKIRHHILPALAEVNPSIVAQLADKNEQYIAQNQFLKQVLHRYAQQCFMASAVGGSLHWQSFEAEFGAAHVPLLIEYVCEQQGLHGNDIAAVLRLRDARSGARALTRRGEWLRTSEGITFAATPFAFPEKPLTISQIHSAVNYWRFIYLWEIYMLSADELISLRKQIADAEPQPANVFYIDTEKIAFPLSFRLWHIGDTMRPLGLKGNKLLSDIFTDNK